MLFDLLFPGTKILGFWHFRVTRNSELYIDEEETNNLLKAVETELHNRRKGEAVRLEIEKDCPLNIRQALLGTFRLDEDDLFVIDGPINPTRLMAVCEGDHSPELRDPPFLGTIATTYKRRELAEAVLVPGKSIAQGFAAHHLELKDGSEVEGFVVQEAADKITLRLITSQELTVNTVDIARRSKLEKSLMPEGLAANLTMKELASLIDYLESLAPRK